MTDISSRTSLELEQDNSSGFQLNRVLTIVSAHLTHDTYTAFLAPLLPNLIEKLSLTYTQAGSLLAFTQLPSILDPIIGYLDDKINLRIFVIFAPAVTATMMSLLGIAPSYLNLVVLLFITGLSSAAFHSIAPAIIARSSGNQVGKGMSLQMAAGELGRTVGPLLASWALLTFTLGGMFPVAIPGWIASLAVFIRLRGIPVHIKKQNSIREVLPVVRQLFIPLVSVAFFRSFLVTALGVYLPTLLEGEGASIWKAGTTLAIYEFAGVIGAFLGGTLSDKLGRKPVLFSVSILAPITLLIFLQASSWLIIPILILSGFFNLSAQPIMLAIVQDHFPTYRSIGNGIYMTFSFICLSLSSVGIGMLADRFGLHQAFEWTAIFGFVASLLVFFIPTPQK
jgi:FSR family fosmidomycin resistance protein-like MFS transporter